MGVMIDKSKLTIQRPEGIPEWAEIGVMVWVKDEDTQEWSGPYPLQGYDCSCGGYMFRAGATWWDKARPCTVEELKERTVWL